MKNDILEHRKAVQQNIMKSFGAGFSDNSLEKGAEDEINPFEMEAYKSELTKAELDEFEKAKHQDGDMHPNGKWVWRQSANGGKGDWRVASPGKRGGDSSKTTVSSGDNSKTTNSSSSYFSKLSNSLIEKYSKKKESVSLSDIEEFYEDFLRDRGQEPTRKAYANEAKKTYDAIVDNWNKQKTSSSGDSKTAVVSNEEKFADMDVKEAKKKLVGKNLTFKDYWGDGKGGSVDATGKITNVRLYGKNKQPVASVEFENGDSATVSLKQIDDGTAAGYDLSLSKDSKTNKTTSNKTVDWDDIKVTKLDDGGLYTAFDKKKRIVTIGSKQYRVDLQNESLSYMNSGVKVKSNAPEMVRFKKLLDANKNNSIERS